ncbi:glycerophosphoryl diester phosphodiesterase [Shimia isoporae]|uniref:Glycerophosphoryl diester phosphodiesterase n=1 Tax=Shimia isoporae TaxID=647720 RepID=A0A4R1NM74_9RHOB|nr:glycerophosphodiester phosphodiesterase family protein [Shimia isoporae]TCL09404.1 glycerophosphoryl diester phosphodiesterase [Shimia isoporae]
MISAAFQDVKESFATGWRLRWPFVAANIVFNILLAAVFAPMMALTVRAALAFSGRPALADFDIAFFLLSPAGAIGGVLLVAMALVLGVMNIAFMMATARHEHHHGQVGLWEGASLVLPQMPSVLSLAVRLTLHVIFLSLPFLAVAGFIASQWLSEFDINYYLTHRPPIFRQSVVVIGGVLGLWVVLLAWRLLGWTLSLPLVIFAGTQPSDALRESRARMQGRRIGFLFRILVWFGVSAAIFIVVMGIVTLVADVALVLIPQSMRALVVVLVLIGALYTAVNVLISAITTGAMSVLIVAEADWPRNRVPPRQIPRKVLIAVSLSAVLFGGFGVVGLAGLAPVDDGQPVEVIAHRGAAGAKPENTMAAINEAVRVGSDWVEIDVQETADGMVAVMHDSDFMKQAGNPLRIWDATQEDLAKIDIGSWFDPVYADQRTPLLADVLRAAKDQSGVVIELKYYGHDEMLEQRVIDIVEAEGMVNQVKVMSLKYDAVEKMRKLRPEWDIGLLASASLGNMWDLDADFLAVNSATASYRLVRESQAVDKKVYVWTVNDPLAMSGMISLGVDGLITDEPELARKVIEERRELSGPERLILGLAGRVGLDLEAWFE